MTISRRSFFGIAAGAAAVLAGAPAMASAVSSSIPEWGCAGMELISIEQANAAWLQKAIDDEILRLLYGVEGSTNYGLLAADQPALPAGVSRIEGEHGPTVKPNVTPGPVVIGVDAPADTRTPFPPIRSIDVRMKREKTISQKEFERRLSSPHGKGRLE